MGNLLGRLIKKQVTKVFRSISHWLRIQASPNCQVIPNLIFDQSSRKMKLLKNFFCTISFTHKNVNLAIWIRALLLPLNPKPSFM